MTFRKHDRVVPYPEDDTTGLFETIKRDFLRENGMKLGSGTV